MASVISLPVLVVVGVFVAGYVFCAVWVPLVEALIGAFIEWRYWSFVARERALS